MSNKKTSRERGLILNADEVRAILAGTKTQLCLPVSPAPIDDPWHSGVDAPSDEIPKWTWWAGNYTKGIYHSASCPLGHQGDRLWVRETWCALEKNRVIYAADGADVPDGNWCSSASMPRWASRVTLEIAAVRATRINSLNRGDAMVQGCPFANLAAGADPMQWFHDAWDRQYGRHLRACNAWIWVVDFTLYKTQA